MRRKIIVNPDKRNESNFVINAENRDNIAHSAWDFTVYKLFFYRFVYSVDTNRIARAAVSYNDIISYNSRKMTMCC